MEENTTTVSSPPTQSNQANIAKVFTNSSKNREEGELSASENDDLAGSQFLDSTLLPGAPLKKDTNVVENGKSAVVQNPTHSAVASRNPVQSNNRKGTEKIRVPFVISFSDDDSDSDSEDYRKGNAFESDDITRGAENRNSSTPLTNSQLVQQTIKPIAKIPKKISTSRTFISSMNRVNGTSSKNGGNPSSGVKSLIKKSNPPSKNKVGPNVHINSNKLQDLRQLIAIRENELKSKAGKLEKEAASISLKNITNMNSRINTVRSRDSAERVVLEPKEPEKKRLKISEPPINTIIPVGQHDRPSTESTLAAGASALESDALKTKKVRNQDMPVSNQPSGSSIIKNSRRQSMVTNREESPAPLAAKTSLPTQGLLNTSSFWNPFGATNVSQTGDMDINSLLEIEELQDKELDEAQEYRRKCEIEERNALKAYRKAQRALAEANAKCSYLYNKRELFSANLRTHVMEDSTMFWSNMPHQQTGVNANSITNMSLVPISDNQLQHRYDLNVRSNDNGKIISDSCGELDTSTSEPQEEEKTNDVCSSLHENNALAEDEQTSAFELKAGGGGGGGSSFDSHGEGACSERGKEVNNDSVTVDPTEDSLLLEATLRSQLFARLGNRGSKKNEADQNMEHVVEREDGEIMEGSGDIPSSETEKDQPCDFGDIGRSEKSKEGDVEKLSVSYGSSLTEPILRSAFGHVNTTMMNPTLSHPQIHTNNEKKVADVAHGPTTTDLVIMSNKWSSEVGCYSNNLGINPFWPHCMFELRGKCNDDECPWQHTRDYSSKNIDDSVLGSSGATAISKSIGSLPLAPPTYLVCLDSLKADSHPYKYLLTQTVEQRWHKYYSASLVVSSSFLADLHSDEPCLHGPETRIEVHGGWNRQSSYFYSKNIKEGVPDQHTDDTDQPLETALLNLTREVNKQKGRREALMVLARALEEHPTSVLLWIVYLHIYYSNQKSIGKDDLFRYAIEHNESSYELWLMFINSREKLSDRLLAYKSALSALCRHASDKNHELYSEYILDLFLQMMNCLISSGETNVAIKKVYELFHITKVTSDSNPPFPHIHTHLTFSDKCVLWICCIYLAMYKNLPDTILQKFECHKELSTIEWPSVQLTPGEKQQAATLVEMASESLSSETKTILKAAQMFALNHVACTAVLRGFDCSNNLLKKYLQLYPLCIELILFSIRFKELDSIDSTFAAFEEALSNYVDKPGVQCIWNQYAQYALQTRKNEFAKELMERWFHSIWEVQYPKSEILNISAWISNSTQTDVVFGLLNLSLHKHLQNEHTEARIAIEQALEVASSDDYNHCVKEHAALLLKNDSSLGDNFMNTLNRYLMDPRVSPPPEPLSRTFIKTITKPKIQKLVNNLLSPISSDYSLLNSVLESCFGSSLSPPSERLTDFVDFIEALMEIKPANYRLALSLCKTQSGANSTVLFWGSALLIDSLFQAVPVAPESVWVEAASTLKNMADLHSMLESFHKRALSVYPFSMKLWKSYVELYASNAEKANLVTEMAREKGIKV